MNKRIVIQLVIGSILLSLALLIMTGKIGQPSPVTLETSAAMELARNGALTNVVFSGTDATVTIKDKAKPARVHLDAAKSNFITVLDSKRVKYNEVPIEEPFDLAIWIGPLLTVIFIIVLIKGSQGLKGQLNKNEGLKKNLSKRADQVSTTKFDDVMGVDGAKKEVMEIVDFLKRPVRYRKLGARIPKGTLFIGPPGTGKTLLAKAVAGEAGVPFFSITGSDFVEMFVGVGAARVRDLFEQAKRHSPSIIFFDEFDAVAGARTPTGSSGGHDERIQTLNAFLAEMDGIGADQDIIVIAATNRPEALDPAAVRPGRFDRKVTVDRPDTKGRAQILAVHAKSKLMAESVNMDLLAQRTSGMVGADLANVINEAALLCARRNGQSVNMDDLYEAAARTKLGTPRGIVMSDLEKRNTALHEAGHAITCHALKNMPPLQGITILPRTNSLGMTMMGYDIERYQQTRIEMEEFLVMGLGGLAAEIKYFGRDGASSGASNDLMRVNQMARNMITKFGMTEKFGLLTVEADASGRPECSPELAREIEMEIKSMLAAAMERARTIIDAQSDVMERLEAVLLEKETLDAEELSALLGPKQVS